MPVQSVRPGIGYGCAEAATTFGVIGGKVCTYKGEVLPEAENRSKVGGNDNVNA